MKRKLFLTFIIMIILPVLILVFSIFMETKKLAVSNMNQTTLQTLENMGKDISDLVSSVEFISDTLFDDTVLKHYVGDVEENDFLTMMDDVTQLRNVFYYYESAADIFRIQLYVNDAKMAARESVHFFPLSIAEDAEWYQETVECGGSGLWTGVHSGDEILEVGTGKLIAYRRMVRAGENFFYNDGVLVLNISEEVMCNYFRQIPIRTTERIYLMDKEGKVLSSPDKEMLEMDLLSAEVDAQILTQKSGVLQTDLEEGTRILIFTAVPETDWFLVDSIHPDYILEGYSYWNDMKLIVWVILIVTVLSAAAFMVVHTFEHELIRRITQMAKRLETGSTPGSCGKTKETEIDKAERLVYEMIEHNQQLREENYKACLEERRVQLFALQAQINPHFLYNTLECINWMAFRRGADEISTAVTTLAKYFRLSLNKGREIVSVAEEIELARTYLAIQNIRFESAIRVDIIVPESMKQYAIPKLALQPFVENAVIHGIMKQPKRCGRILIEAVENEAEIRLYVEDDGRGMSNELIKEILSEQQNGHYGIYNANERIHLYFGNEYGVEIQSREGEGTRVEITMGKILLKNSE